MQTVALKASPRTSHGKGPARQLRNGGQVPTVAYGLKGDTLSVAVAHDDLRDILLSPRGRNTIIDLQVDGVETTHVMVKEYTVHPLSRRVLHADFIRIDDNTIIEVEVPFHPQGKSKGEAEGGTLLALTRTIRVSCLPNNIPDEIVHDVSELMIDDTVSVKDLTLPEGIKVLFDDDHKLINVQPPRVIEADTVEGEEGEEGEEGAVEGEEGKDGDKPAEGDAKAEDKKDKK